MKTDDTSRTRLPADGREASLFASHVHALAEGLGVACHASGACEQFAVGAALGTTPSRW